MSKVTTGSNDRRPDRRRRDGARQGLEFGSRAEFSGAPADHVVEGYDVGSLPVALECGDGHASLGVVESSLDRKHRLHEGGGP
jgi:hypothetical protein